MRVATLRVRPSTFVAAVAVAALCAAITAAPAAAAPPVCTDQSYTVESGQDLFVPVNGPCSDDDGPNALQGVIVSPPSHGTIGPGPDGGGIYRSHTGYNGPDSFTYRASDGAEQSNVATVTIEVTPASGEPQAPECFDSFGSVYSGRTTAFFLQCTDPDTPLEDLELTVVEDFQNGVRSDPLPLQGLATYTPEAGFSGTDTLTFRVSDGVNDSNLASVTIQVQPVPEGNLPPTCPESRAYVPAGQSIVLVANCVDPDGDLITYSLAPPFVTGGTAGPPFTCCSITYTPFPGTVEDELGYSAADPYHDPVVFSVKIFVTDGTGPVETAPEATEGEPFAASVNTPVQGPVYVDARAVTVTAPTGYFLLGQEFDITAPPALEPTDPLRFVFKLDSSLLDDLSPEDITVFRNGAPIPDCDAPGTGVAEPWPCIDARESQPDGDLWITALTMQASIYTFGVAEQADDDGDGDGVPDDADNCVEVPNPDQADVDQDGVGAACDTKEAPTVAAECMKNGWRAFGGIYRFATQGDCVSFVETGGRNAPAG